MQAKHRSGAVKNYYAAVSTKAEFPIFDMYFQNPYNDNDYDIIEDLWANTLIGETIDKKAQFVMGGGIKPTLRLRSPKDYSESQQIALLDKWQWVIDDLVDLDDKRKIKFNKNLYNAEVMKKVFGRCVIGYEPGGKSATSAIKVFHPRDLGRVNPHQDDWSVSSVQLYNRTEILHDFEMLYLLNRDNSPRRRSKNYGFSDVQRVAGAGRALRKIMEFDLPEISETMWAGYGLISVDTIAKSPGAIKQELDTIREGLKPGALNLINGKKDDVNYWKFDLDPKINEIVEAAKYYERMIIGHSGVPAALFGREEDQNMATLYGKMKMFTTGPIRFDREQLSEPCNEYWYERNTKSIAPEALQLFAIEAEFEPIVWESWVDVVDSLGKLKAIFPTIPEKELLILANLPELQDKLQTTDDKGQNKKDAEEVAEKYENEETEIPDEQLSPDQIPENPERAAATLFKNKNKTRKR